MSADYDAQIAEEEDTPPAPIVDLRAAVQNLQPPEDAHEIWKHGFLVACQSIVAIIDSPKVVTQDDKIRELLREVAQSGVTFDDERVGYLEVQINRVTWDEIGTLVK